MPLLFGSFVWESADNAPIKPKSFHIFFRVRFFFPSEDEHELS